MYESKIISASQELTKKEQAKLLNLSAIPTFDNVVPDDGEICIIPSGYVELEVHNEKAKGDKDYKNYIVYTKDGEVYRTGSESFYQAFKPLWELFNSGDETEEFELVIYKSPSKNYSGKCYLTCTVK